MNDKIIKIANKINEKLKKEEIVKDYHKYLQVINKSDFLLVEEKLKTLQKQMVNALNDEEDELYQDLKKEYEATLKDFKENPLYSNYEEIVDNLNDLLQQIAFIIDSDLNR